jgi:hypothetical protein
VVRIIVSAACALLITGVAYAGATIQGHVTDVDSGLPIAGVPIVLSTVVFGSLDPVPEVPDAVSNAQGYYQILDAPTDHSVVVRAVPAAPYVGRIWPNFPCASTQQQGPCSFSSYGNVSPTEGQVVTADFGLGVVGTVSGTIRTLGLQPIAGASVKVEWYDHPGYWLANATTNASGAFVVNGLPHGDYKVSVAAQTYRSEVYDDLACNLFCEPIAGDRVAVSSGEASPGIDFELTNGAVLGGTVHDDDLITLAYGVQVQLARYQNGSWESVASANADPPDGHFQFEGLAEGTYVLSAGSPALAPGYGAELYDDVPCPQAGCAGMLATGRRSRSVLGRS